WPALGRRVPRRVARRRPDQRWRRRRRRTDQWAARGGVESHLRRERRWLSVRLRLLPALALVLSVRHDRIRSRPLAPSDGAHAAAGSVSARSRRPLRLRAVEPTGARSGAGAVPVARPSVRLEPVRPRDLPLSAPSDWTRVQ